MMIFHLSFTPFYSSLFLFDSKKNRYLQFRLFIKAHTAKKNCKTFGNIILFSLLCSRNLTTNERNPSGNCVKVILENGNSELSR